MGKLPRRRTEHLECLPDMQLFAYLHYLLLPLGMTEAHFAKRKTERAKFDGRKIECG